MVVVVLVSLGDGPSDGESLLVLFRSAARGVVMVMVLVCLRD